MGQDYLCFVFYADAMSTPVSIRILEGVTEQNLARTIFDEVWPSAEGTQITANLLQALVHNGTYISGAFVDGEIVAAAFAFPGRDDHGHFHLHSHMAAVKEEFRNQSIGSQIKWHQRAWAMEKGYDTITWTFDPLVRRNAKLNLVKLGVQVFDYFSDFYGDLPDALNAGDPTDRTIAHWKLDAGRVSDALNRKLFFPINDSPVALANIHGTPLTQDVDQSASTILCYIPEDIIEIRSKNSELALRWRLALRQELQSRLADGWSIAGFTQDGAYIISKHKGDR
jgi:predicted GNAT superfamily acetyltransferase